MEESHEEREEEVRRRELEGKDKEGRAVWCMSLWHGDRGMTLPRREEMEEDDEGK